MAKRHFLLHPILFAVYPVLFLYANNADQIAPGVMRIPLSLAFGVLALVWLVFHFTIKKEPKAALLTTLFLIWFFGYGPLFEATFTYFIGRFVVQHRHLLILWTLPFLYAGYRIARYSRSLDGLNRFLNVMGAVLVGMSFFTIGSYYWKTRDELRMIRADKEASAATPVIASNKPQPDIYYILLDMHAGPTTLKTLYGYDCSPFLQSLQKMGFYVADKSHSNYPITLTSLPSSLNYEYLDFLSPRMGTETKSLSALNAMVRHDKVSEFLSARGYECIRSGFFAAPFAEEFVQMFLRDNPVGYFLDNLQDPRERVLKAVGELEALAVPHRKPGEKRRPRFIYAHILCPHTPFVFSPQGETVPSSVQARAENDRKLKIQLYVGQVAYIDSRIQHIVGEILAHAETPPIIIIQGDHGPVGLTTKQEPVYLQEAFGILNAYYLPDGDKSILYDSISPVNSFRVIFDHYFDAKLPLLPDKSYFTTYAAPYKYQDVTQIAHQDYGADAHPTASSGAKKALVGIQMRSAGSTLDRD